MSLIALGQILALVLGFVSLGLISWVRDRKTNQRLIWMPATLVIYNVWVALFLASSYFGGRLFPMLANGRLHLSVEALTVALTALAIGWGCAHVAQIFALAGLPVPRQVLRLLCCLVLLVAIATVISWFCTLRLESSLPLAVVAAISRLIVFAIALYSSGWLYVKSRAHDDSAWGRRLKILAIAYFAVFFALTTVTLTWAGLSRVSRMLAPLLDVAIEISYNIVAVAWLVPLAGWPARENSSPGTDDATARIRDITIGGGITQRESEIIELICKGRTNKEIADQLFISVTTVKDHNQAIFRKLGVRNRTEVTRLILGGSTLQK